MPQIQDLINNNFTQIQNHLNILRVSSFNLPSQITIYLVRHGSTDLNERGMLRGWADVPLSELGIKQAQADAKYFKNAGITKIYNSDLKRTQKTADFISQTTGVKIESVSDLRPLNFGDLNGKPMNLVSPIMDDFNDKWSQNADYKAHNSESFNEFQNRNLNFFKQILQQAQPNDKIVLVLSLRNCSLFLSWILLNSQPPNMTMVLSQAKPLQGQNVQIMSIIGQEPGSISELQYNQGRLSFIKNLHNEEGS